MRRLNLFVITFFCVMVYAVQAKENFTKVNDRLETTRHLPVMQSMDDTQQSNFKMLKLENLSDFNLTKKSKSTAFRAHQSSDETSQLLDSIVTKNTDGIIVSKTIYGYDSQGNCVSTSTSNYNIGTQQWTDSIKFEYEYNNNNDQTLNVEYSWDSEAGLWQVFSRIETEWSVDSENNKTFVRIKSIWDTETQIQTFATKEEIVFQGNTTTYKLRIIYVKSAGVWVPNSKLEQLYDDDGYNYTKGEYIWSNEHNAWRGTSKIGYVYSADNTYNQLVAHYYWDYDVYDWEAKTEFEYDRYNNKIATGEFIKNGENWKAISKTGNEGDYIVYYNLVNNAFVKTHKDKTTYDGNNNLKSYVRFDWDEGANNWYLSKHIERCFWDNLSGEWRIFEFIEQGYNKNGQILYRIQFLRNNSQSEWIAGYTFKSENTYDEDGRQTARINYNWAGGEPTVLLNSFSFGDFTATATSHFNGVQSWTVNITKDIYDSNKVWIKNLVLGGSSESTPVYGTLNTAKTELKIPVKQVIAVNMSSNIYLEGYYGPDGVLAIPAGESITGIINSDGTINIQDKFGSKAYSQTDGSVVGWFNVFQADGVFVPKNGPTNNYIWTSNWTESQRANYFYSEHDITDDVPTYEVKTQAYPNPANDQLTITGTKAGQNIRITNLNGQLINSFTAEEGNTIISLSSFIAGMYLVNIDDYTVKIVKE